LGYDLHGADKPLKTNSTYRGVEIWNNIGDGGSSYDFDLNGVRYHVGGTLRHLLDDNMDLDPDAEIAKVQEELIVIVDSILDQAGIPVADEVDSNSINSKLSPQIDSLEIGESEKETAAIFMDDRDIGGDASSEILFNHDGIPKFILCISSGGYLIMDRDTNVVLESGQGAGPYAEYPDARKYYGGFGCYIVETEDGLFDIIYKTIVGSIPYIKAVDELGDTEASRDETGTLSAGSQTGTATKKLDANIADIATLSFANNGGSTSNTCSAVACGIALNYLDRTIDNNIVPNVMEATPLDVNNPDWDSILYPETEALHNYLVNDCGMGPVTYGDSISYGLFWYRDGDSSVEQTGIHTEWTLFSPKNLKSQAV
jgi:hypothetical protein